MWVTLGQLLITLVLILVAAEVFTNALEHLGERLGISEGVTGSLFAAIGTALPETLVPILAIVAGGSNAAVNQEISVGAILGAPLMLSTLSTCLMALAAWRGRGLQGLVSPEHRGFVRDVEFFLFAFMLAALAMFIPHPMIWARAAISLALVGTYVAYVVRTFQASEALVAEGHGTEAHEPMLLTRLGLPAGLPLILLQLALGLVILVIGARGFIYGVEEASHLLHLSPLLLSLMVIPIATELPEKINSILWVGKGKDTLAFGNITGAMVFQGTLLPAMGILLTPWGPRREVLLGVLLTVLAATWLRTRIDRGGLRVWQLMLNGLLYVIYLGLMLG
jgi:cation:H+ antiporter